jgi:hypothetical protein
LVLEPVAWAFRHCLLNLRPLLELRHAQGSLWV